MFEKFLNKMGYLTDEQVQGKMDKQWQDINASFNQVTDIFGGQITKRDTESLLESYRSWVYTCISKIAKTFATMPIRFYVYRQNGKMINGRQVKSVVNNNPDRKPRAVYEREYLKSNNIKKEEITDHPIIQLINRPNDMLTRYDLIYDTIVKLELLGSVGWYIPKNGLGVPGEIWVLPLRKSAELKPIPDSKNVLAGYEYRDGRNVTKFDKDEIVYFRYPDPADLYKGLSPLLAQSYPYDIENYLMQQQRETFKEKMTPGNVFTTDKSLNETQVKALVEHMRSELRGTKNSGKPMVLHSGLKQDNPAGLKQGDLAINELGEFTRDKIISSYDLSPGKVGLVKDVNRANMDVLDKTFYGECISPRATMVDEKMNSFLTPFFDDRIVAEIGVPNVRDRGLDLEERKTNLETAYTTINEEREKEGKDPVSWGDKPILPFNVVHFNGGDKPDKEEPEKSYYASDDLLDMEWKEFANRQEDYELPLKRAMEGFFKEQGDEVAKKVEEVGVRVNGQLAGWNKNKKQKWIKEHKDNHLADMNIDKDESINTLKEIKAPLIKDIMLKNGQARLDNILNQKDLTVDYAIPDGSDDAAFIADSVDDWAKEITETTHTEVQALLREGFTEEVVASEIAMKIREKFNNYADYRAKAAATTETVAAMNRADVSAVKQSGVGDKFKKAWLSSRDSQVRDSHVAADRRYASGIPVDEEFTVGSDRMDAPGLGTVAKENINCRCTLTYIRKKDGQNG